MMYRKRGMAKTFGKYSAVAGLALRNRLAYPKDLLGRMFFTAFVLFVYNRLWGKILGANGDFAGFTKAQLTWYMAFTEGIGLSFPRLQGTISEDVKTGNIAYRLNKPLHYLGQLLAEYLGETAVGLIITLSIAVLTAFILVGGLPDLTFPRLLGVSGAVLLGALLSFCLSAALALSAFWVEDNGPFFWIYSKISFVLGGLFIPVEVYPGWLRSLAVFLPFRLVFAGAARLAVRFDAALYAATIAAQLAWLLPAAALAVLIFRRGVRKLNVNGG